jgi:hypothetical protein
VAFGGSGLVAVAVAQTGVPPKKNLCPLDFIT